jgi:hypothetical protein
VSPIRILLAGVPVGLPAAVHAAVAGESDLLVVGETSGEVETLLETGRAGADVVIVGMSNAALPPIAERLIDEYPRIGVLAVDLDRDEGVLYRLRPQSAWIGDIRVTGLAVVVRRAAEQVG